MSRMQMWACCACVKLLSSTALQYILMSLFAIRWLGLWKRWSTKKCAAEWHEEKRGSEVKWVNVIFFFSSLVWITHREAWQLRDPPWSGSIGEPGVCTCVCVFWWSVAGENCCLEAEYVRNCRPTESHGYLNKSYSEANAMCTMCSVTFDTPDYTHLTLTQFSLCFFSVFFVVVFYESILIWYLKLLVTPQRTKWCSLTSHRWHVNILNQAC